MNSEADVYARISEGSTASELEKRPVRDNADSAPSASPSPAPSATVPESGSAPTGGRTLSYAEQKERDKILRKAERAVKQAEEQISSLESEITEMEGKIAAGACDEELLTSYADSQKALEEAMLRWEEASEHLESLKE